MASADSVDILERARSDAAVIVSSDTDFGTLLAAQRATFPSVILTREVSTLPTVDLAELIIANLPVVAGCAGTWGDRGGRTEGTPRARLPLR